MKEEIGFATLCLAFTCLLLLLRSLFLSRLHRRSTYYKVTADDGGDGSGWGGPKDRESIGLSLVASERLDFTTSTDDWPSEIIVSSDVFHQK